MRFQVHFPSCVCPRPQKHCRALSRMPWVPLLSLLCLVRSSPFQTAAQASLSGFPQSAHPGLEHSPRPTVLAVHEAICSGASWAEGRHLCISYLFCLASFLRSVNIWYKFINNVNEYFNSTLIQIVARSLPSMLNTCFRIQKEDDARETLGHVSIHISTHQYEAISHKRQEDVSTILSFFKLLLCPFELESGSRPF